MGLGIIGTALAGAASGAGEFASGYLAKSQLQDEAAAIQAKRDQTIAVLARETHAANAGVDTEQHLERERRGIPLAVEKADALRPGAMATKQGEAEITRETERRKPMSIDGARVEPSSDPNMPATITEVVPGKGAAAVTESTSRAKYAEAHATTEAGRPAREDARDRRMMDAAERARLHDVLAGATTEARNAQAEEQKLRENFRKEHELTPPTDTERATHASEVSKARKRMEKAQQTMDDANRRLLSGGKGANAGSAGGTSERPPLDAFAGKTAPVTPAPVDQPPAAKPRNGGIISRAMQTENPFADGATLPAGATRNPDGTIEFSPKAPPRVLPPFLRQ